MNSSKFHEQTLIAIIETMFIEKTPKNCIRQIVLLNNYFSNLDEADREKFINSEVPKVILNLASNSKNVFNAIRFYIQEKDLINSFIPHIDYFLNNCNKVMIKSIITLYNDGKLGNLHIITEDVLLANQKTKKEFVMNKLKGE